MADNVNREPDLSANLVETHTALIFFVGDRVYKLKKALDLGFLDHRSREARLASCRNEVELNQRLAPDVYLGVYDIHGPDGEVLDHLVAMRRMPDDRRLARCLERGEDVEEALRAIARSVATLHAASTSDPDHDRLATVEACRGRWAEGFDQLRELADGPDAPRGLDAELRGRLDESERLAMRFLDGRRALFDRRMAEGWVRDGHGDLQAEDVFLLDDGPRVLDCIEFGEDYRWGDVLADVAFLAMDLERHGREDLAHRFLRWYRELIGDGWPETLAHHYIAYRAHVRAKVGILRAAQRDEAVSDETVALVDQSLVHLRDAQVDLILVGGAPGTGKSTVAAALGDGLGAIVLRSDEIRLGMDLGEDRYEPAAVTAVYEAMVAEASRLLALGERVVLDATWGSEDHRRLARRVAENAHADLLAVQCQLDPQVAAERVRRRGIEGRDPSEATPAVANALAARFEPWAEAVALDTTDAPEAVAARAIEVIRAGRR